MISILIESLLEDELFSPLKKFFIPDFVLKSHLKEDEEVDDNISQHDGAPPIQSLLFKDNISENHSNIERKSNS